MDHWVQSGDQAPVSSVEDSDVAEAEESEDGQVQNQGDVDCFLWCEGHCARRILTKGPDHQPTHLQGRPATFDAVSAREEATKVRKQIMAASPRHCSGAQYIKHPGISYQKYHCCTGATSILSRPTPCNCFLFPKFKRVMKGIRFPDVEASKMAVTKEL